MLLKKWEKKFQNGIIEVVVGENWEKNKHLLSASNEHRLLKTFQRIKQI